MSPISSAVEIPGSKMSSFAGRQLVATRAGSGEQRVLFETASVVLDDEM